MITEVETIAGDLFENQILYALTHSGILAKLYKKIDSVYDTYYGPQYTDDDSSNEEVEPTEIKILMSGSSRNVFDLQVADASEVSAMFSLDEVGIGDVIEVVRGDGRTRKYKVISVEGIGTTEVVAWNFKVSALGE